MCKEPTKNCPNRLKLKQNVHQWKEEDYALMINLRLRQFNVIEIDPPTKKRFFLVMSASMNLNLYCL